MPPEVFAHGTAGPGDLPAPLWLVAVAAAHGRLVPSPPGAIGRVVGIAARAVVLACFALVVVTAWWGVDVGALHSQTPVLAVMIVTVIAAVLLLIGG